MDAEEQRAGAVRTVQLERVAAERAVERVGHAVRAARDAGAEWAAIGRALGVSRQAAAQRWAAWLDPDEAGAAERAAAQRRRLEVARAERAKRRR